METKTNSQTNGSVDSGDRIVSRLREATIGDNVFVVWQNDRYRQREKLPCKTSEETIVKVGRKYAYIGEGRSEKKFERGTGKSWHHPDSNARCNGYGFDVYVDEQAYLKEQHEFSESVRLENRMIARNGRLHSFKPSVVESIHRLLDSEGLD